MPPRSQRTPSRRFNASSFVAGLVAGVGVSMISFYLLGIPGSPDETSAGGANVAPEGSDEQNGPRRFEFFERLPGAKVSTDTEPYKSLTPGGYVAPTEVAPAEVEPTEAAPAQAAPAEYVVQAGSFPEQDDANRLRARLMLTGMGADIRIDTQETGDGVWHRVVIGPFSSKQDAEQTVASLQQHDVSSILLEVPPSG